jgi:hypothetical protein
MPLMSVPVAIDSHLDGNPVGDQSVNYGTEQLVTCGVEHPGAKSNLRRAIMNFDVNPLAGRTISAASLWRYVTQIDGSSQVIRVSRCTRPSTWTETGVTWAKYDGSNNWTTGGGDFDDATPASFTYTEDTFLWRELTGFKALIDDAIASRGGIVSIILRNTDENPGVTRFAGWNGKNATVNNPYLLVDHDGDPIDNVRRIERRAMRGMMRGAMRGT